MLRGIYPLRSVARGAAAFARAPRAAMRLAQELRSLDLRRECARVRAHGIPVRVIGCTSDTLVRGENARALAAALGARYIELGIDGGHMWLLTQRACFGGTLRA
jgi:hypothetical protein